jgi:hypothetical protein
MIKPKQKNTSLLLVASHSFVATVVSNPYLQFVISDIIKMITNDTTEVVFNQSLATSMSVVSLTFLMVSIVAFAIYKLKRSRS